MGWIPGLGTSICCGYSLKIKEVIFGSKWWVWGRLAKQTTDFLLKAAQGDETSDEEFSDVEAGGFSLN